ncbi:MAG: hypothetical protein MUD08_08745 [Cytophagales bacterium]|jgi:hypothetical protein|nr:hypothetical protein [Cytophagales bacterium]
MKTTPLFRKTLTGFWLAATVLSFGVSTSCQRRETYRSTAANQKAPAVVQNYLNALQQGDLTAQRAAFSENAVISDEVDSHADEAALRRWLHHHHAIYRQVRVLETVATDSGHTLRLRWIPDQPESGWEAYYTFVHDGDKIERLHVRSEQQ